MSSSELRHRNTKKKDKEEEEEEEEIVQDEEDQEEEEEHEEEEKLVKKDKRDESSKKTKPKQKTRTRVKKEDGEPLYASKTVEYTVAIVRVILILVVFTILHGWVTKYFLDPLMGRDQSNLHFTCPEGMDCQKLREQVEKLHFKG